MTKEDSFNQDERRVLKQMDEAAEKNNRFIPVIGMEPSSIKGDGYKGRIEYVGRDYFILRSYRSGEPVLISPSMYHNFENYIKKS